MGRALYATRPQESSTVLESVPHSKEREKSMNETALALAAYLRDHETRPEAPESTEERAEREETARERCLPRCRPGRCAVTWTRRRGH